MDAQVKKSRVRKRTHPSKPRNRGPLGFSIVEAGAMIGLGRDASYQAAKAGQIPTIEIGHLKIVPRAVWLRRLGVEEIENSIPKEAAE